MSADQEQRLQITVNGELLGIDFEQPGPPDRDGVPEPSFADSLATDQRDVAVADLSQHNFDTDYSRAGFDWRMQGAEAVCSYVPVQAEESGQPARLREWIKRRLHQKRLTQCTLSQVSQVTEQQQNQEVNALIALHWRTQTSAHATPIGHKLYNSGFLSIQEGLPDGEPMRVIWAGANAAQAVIRSVRFDENARLVEVDLRVRSKDECVCMRSNDISSFDDLMVSPGQLSSGNFLGCAEFEEETELNIAFGGEDQSTVSLTVASHQVDVTDTSGTPFMAVALARGKGVCELGQAPLPAQPPIACRPLHKSEKLRIQAHMHGYWQRVAAVQTDADLKHAIINVINERREQNHHIDCEKIRIFCQEYLDRGQDDFMAAVCDVAIKTVGYLERKNTGNGADAIILGWKKEIHKAALFCMVDKIQEHGIERLNAVQTKAVVESYEGAFKDEVNPSTAGRRVVSKEDCLAVHRGDEHFARDLVLSILFAGPTLFVPLIMVLYRHFCTTKAEKLKAESEDRLSVFKQDAPQPPPVPQRVRQRVD